MQLFAGKTFSSVMNSRAEQMEAEIQKLKCADLEGLTDDQLSAKAETYAIKYAPNIPTINRSEQKAHSEENQDKKYWLVPFSGDKEFFTFVPSGVVPQCYVETIDGQCLRINVAGTSDISVEQAESNGNKLLTTIETLLSTLQHDAQMNHSKDKFKQTAENVMKRKRESCAKLRAKGYSVR